MIDEIRITSDCADLPCHGTVIAVIESGLCRYRCAARAHLRPREIGGGPGLIAEYWYDEQWL